MTVPSKLWNIIFKAGSSKVFWQTGRYKKQRAEIVCVTRCNQETPWSALKRGLVFMQITNAAEVKRMQALMQGIRHAEEEDSRKSAGRHLAASVKNAVYANEEKGYTPSQEGLSMLNGGQDELSYLQSLWEGTKSEEKSGVGDDIKAMKIARNIMKGNVVPARDEKFLMQYDMALWQAAKNIAMLKERGEKVKSELGDEEENVTRDKLSELTGGNIQPADAGGSVSGGVSSEGVSSEE